MSIEWKEALGYFLNEYVPRYRGLSPCTRMGYAKCLKSFTGYLKRHREIPPPCAVGVESVLGFLDWLEKGNGNSPITRNIRLAALKAFWKVLKIVDPDCMPKYDRLLALPFKRCVRRTPDYLEMDELRFILDRIDPATARGFRDLVILRFMYNTGARISEVADARLANLYIDDRREVLIRGKGGRIRVCPLWGTTTELLKLYIRRERLAPRPGYEDFLFTTRLGRSFTRCGLWRILRDRFDRASEVYPLLQRKRITPHTIRHTIAVHLLRSGVDINVIKAMLGHRDVETTSGYLDLDLDKKREALEKFRDLDSLKLPPSVVQLDWELEDHFLKWVDSI